MTPAHRYAIVHCPNYGGRLWEIGCSWLGRDPVSGAPLPQPDLPGLDRLRLRELTRIPAHHGFQGTIVSPFRLIDATRGTDIADNLSVFAARQRSFVLPGLRLRLFNDHFCLRPAYHPLEMVQMAADCVRVFNRFRAPLTTSQLARRRAVILSPEEKQNLEQWGYPYVFNQFRFHVTLTSRITNPREKEIFYSALTELFAPVLDAPLIIDAIHLFVEPAAGRPMRCMGDYPFSRSNSALEPLPVHDKPDQDLHSRHQRHPA